MTLLNNWLYVYLAVAVIVDGTIAILFYRRYRLKKAQYAKAHQMHQKFLQIYRLEPVSPWTSKGKMVQVTVNSKLEEAHTAFMRACAKEEEVTRPYGTAYASRTKGEADVANDVSQYDKLHAEVERLRRDFEIKKAVATFFEYKVPLSVSVK